MRILCGAVALLSLAACNNGISCSTVTDDVGDICNSQALAAGIQSVLEVREQCGAGCTGAPSCTAIYRNGQVVLDVEQDVCSDSQTTSCADLGCQKRVMRCALPPLGAGDYPLVAPGRSSQILHVQQGGTATCRFAFDGGVQ